MKIITGKFKVKKETEKAYLLNEEISRSEFWVPKVAVKEIREKYLIANWWKGEYPGRPIIIIYDNGISMTIRDDVYKVQDELDLILFEIAIKENYKVRTDTNSIRIIIPEEVWMREFKKLNK